MVYYDALRTKIDMSLTPKKESEEMSMLVWTNFHSFVITYII